jgi:hypothetical protein
LLIERLCGFVQKAIERVHVLSQAPENKKRTVLRPSGAGVNSTRGRPIGRI